MSKHTPGEVKVFHPPVGVPDVQFVNGLPSDEDCDLFLCRMFNGARTDANAERIALVWNCHDDLLDALEVAVKHLYAASNVFNDPRFTDRHSQGPGIRDACNAARAVIAKARGE